MKAKYETERTKNAGQMRILNSGKHGKDNTKGYLWVGYHGGMLQETFSRERKKFNHQRNAFEKSTKSDGKCRRNSTPSRDEIKTRLSEREK